LEQPEETMPTPPEPETRGDKKELRAAVRARRAQRSPEDQAAFAEALARWQPPEGTRRVALFLGVGDEPDTGPLIAALHARGVEVIVPITLDDFSLDWAVFTGPDELADGRFGLREPTGPRLGHAAIGSADVVLVPGLSVDAEGRRLGQGAGCYDRSLPFVPDTTPVLAVVYPDERVEGPLPEEPHDRRVDGVLP
jgi:5-formyltetrahydrofolate cyclo-ligase